ncbi:hypothetical protein Tsubulata_025824 [Turnera subulata]|uniref:Uncharacterized protein n=1 Tax=Turnera subulata TaxID=218843 RepID=A0A9Q0FB52_9ROSI|nr:hypothetical protein Tsubulata_025824 [Turnera subulata]
MSGWSEWSSCDDIYTFPLLKKLIIRECNNLRVSLPFELPCLEVLEVIRCCKLELDKLPRSNKICKVTIQKLDSYEFVELCKLTCSPRLYHLKIGTIPSMESLVKLLEPTGCVRVTQSIVMVECSGIKRFLLDQFPSLESLHIRSCDNLESLSAEIPGPPPSLSTALTDLYIWNCASFKSLPPLPSLVELTIGNCPAFESFGVALPANLQKLNVSDCPKLDFGGPLPANLQNLEVSFGGELDSFGGPLPPNLQNLMVSYCPAFESFGGLLPANLQKLDVTHCPELGSFGGIGPLIMARDETYDGRWWFSAED